MDSTVARQDEVARALATKSFSAHVMFDQIGASDDEAADGIKSSIMRVWRRAGCPAGALHRATELSAQLALMIGDEDAAAFEAEGVTHERQVALAQRATAFLVAMAEDIDTGTPSA